ncbi:E3 ubiquitin-protein ligase TRIM56-like [Pecten maximus]|uniref:E3 ubiquitin-protein ligase TRIM56-like n=1 Tax=Pecten maximus TaxID=6579 RepID=UPI0014583290|nr:E3 ubiquitin-protein ligase TRIM56-like [Pecten maximus]
MEASHMKKTFEELSEECLKCSVCSKLFDNHEHIPRYYPCMHTTCEGCMSRQFMPIDTGGYIIRCPQCDRPYHASSPPDVTNYILNNTLLSVKEFISSREKEEFCEKCSDQLSEAVCTDCELSLCRSCTDSIHIGNNSNHNVIFGTRRQDIPKNACRICLNQSDIYCSTCKLFFCQMCETIHHNDKSARTHEVIQFIKEEEEEEEEEEEGEEEGELHGNRLWVMGKQL